MDANRDYEEMLSVVGRFGRYHQIFVGIVGPLAILQATTFLCNAMLSDGIPDYHCVSNDEMYHSIKKTCNRTSSVYADCFDETCNLSKDSLDETITQRQCDVEFSNNTNPNITSPCENIPPVTCTSWKYNGSAFHSSVATEFDLVCDNAWKSQMASMSLMGGLLFGSFLFGQVSDRLGRKPALVLASILLSVSEFTSTLSSNFTIYCVLQLLCGASFIGCASIGYVIVIETGSLRHRVAYGQSCQISMSISFMLLGLIGYLIPDWRIVGKLSSGLTVPFMVVFAIYCVESPRWLYARGNVNRGDDALRRIARSNCKEDKLVSFLQNYEISTSEKREMIGKKTTETDESSLGIIDLFKHKTLIKFTCVLVYNWFVAVCVYYGLNFSTGQLGGSVFVNIFFNGLVEIPGYLISAFGMEKWGRRPMCSFMLFLSGISLMCMIFAADSDTVSLVLFLLGKLGCSGAFGGIYLLTAELYPTPARGIGFGLCSGLSRFGGLASVAIVMLATRSRVLPYMILGALAFVAGVLICCLPETRQQGFPDSIDECKTLDNRGKLKISLSC